MHGSATTTEAVRRAIQHSQESLRALAKRYGINQKTVSKWKKRSSVADVLTGQKEAHSTVLLLEDAALLGKQHITTVQNRETGVWEKWLRVNPGKSKSKVQGTRVLVEVPLLPELEAELARTPSDRLTFLVTEYGKPFSEKGLGNRMRRWCDQAGLPQCSAHGVRKAGATVAAENGATHEQLKAIYGWTNYQQARSPNQKGASSQGRSIGAIAPRI